MLDFLIGVCQGVADAVVGTVKSIVANPEATAILTLSAVGTTAVVSELPFTMAMPLWLESAIVAPMLLPVMSVLFITGLVLIMKWRLSLEG
jgi:uncharacterized protein (DUF983 family)